MKTVYLATSNRGKVVLITRVLLGFGIKVMHKNLDMPEPRSYDLQEIAEAKVLYAYSKIKKPCIVLDSGFFIPAVNGFPRTFVNFALETIGIGGILRLVADKSRRCEFGDCLAYYDGHDRPRFFSARITGSIARKPAGRRRDHSWSDLFLIFIPRGENRTLGQMDEKTYWNWILSVASKTYLKDFAEWYLKQ